jgi:hypothetical protein
MLHLLVAFSKLAWSKAAIRDSRHRNAHRKKLHVGFPGPTTAWAQYLPKVYGATSFSPSKIESWTVSIHWNLSVLQLYYSAKGPLLCCQASSPYDKCLPRVRTGRLELISNKLRQPHRMVLCWLQLIRLGKCPLQSPSQCSNCLSLWRSGVLELH